MAGLTAAQLVAQERDLLQLFGAAVAFRDGFPADAGLAGTPILQSINQFLAFCSTTRIRCEDFTVASVAGTYRYVIDTSVLEVLGVRYAGTALTKTSREALEARDKSWYGKTGTPVSWFKEGGRIFLSYPPVASADTITYDGSCGIATLVNTTDVLASIPDALQWMVPFGGAYIGAVVDAENATQAARKDEWKAIGDSLLTMLSKLYREDYLPPISLDSYRPGINQSMGLT